MKSAPGDSETVLRGAVGSLPSVVQAPRVYGRAGDPGECLQKQLSTPRCLEPPCFECAAGAACWGRVWDCVRASALDLQQPGSHGAGRMSALSDLGPPRIPEQDWVFSPSTHSLIPSFSTDSSVRTMCQPPCEALKTQGKHIQTPSLRQDPSTVQGDTGTETRSMSPPASTANSHQSCCG